MYSGIDYLLHGAESFWEGNWFAASQEIPRITPGLQKFIIGKP